MKEKFSDMGEYHDPNLRLERTEIAQQDFDAQVSPIFVDQVVKQIQNELGIEIRKSPDLGVREIKIMAMNRFLDLIEKGLLSTKEAEKCYQRFAHMVDFYYGS